MWPHTHTHTHTYTHTQTHTHTHRHTHTQKAFVPYEGKQRDIQTVRGQDIQSW